MRWVTFVERDGTAEAVGVLDGDRVAVVSRERSLAELLGLGADAWSELGRRALSFGPSVALEEVTLRAPVPVPPSLRDFSTFEQHIVAAARERGGQVVRQWYEVPTFWFMSPRSVVGPTDEVRVPPGSAVFDFEVELAVVIGRAGRDIPVDEAESHVAGFTVMNDWTARDIVGRDIRIGLGPAKGKDTGTTLGPALVTLDELEEYRTGSGWDIEMAVSVNGREYGRDSAANMYWSFAEMIAYASRGAWLVPGDVLASGPSGYGCLKELRFVHGAGRFPWLVPGDEVTVAATGLGELRNRVVADVEPVALRPRG